MHPERFAPAVLGRLDAVGEAAHPVVQQRSIDEARPDIERVDQFPIEPLEAPSLVGANDEIGVGSQEPMIEIDHPADEFRWEDADAAVIQEIDAGWPAGHVAHGVVAEMRISGDYPIAGEPTPPR